MASLVFEAMARATKGQRVGWIYKTERMESLMNPRLMYCFHTCDHYDQLYFVLYASLV